MKALKTSEQCLTQRRDRNRLRTTIIERSGTKKTHVTLNPLSMCTVVLVNFNTSA